MTKTATKALTALLTGANTWVATYLPAIWAGAIGVLTATVLVFLVPNARTTRVDPEAGAVEPGSLALGLVIGILVAGFLWYPR